MSACGGDLMTRVETTCGGGVRYVTDAEAAELLAAGHFVEVAREGWQGCVRVLRDVEPPEVQERAAGARSHDFRSDVAAGFAVMKGRNITRFWCTCGCTWRQPDDGGTVICPVCSEGRDVVRDTIERKRA